MATDNDLTALMPQPPPPRPARREAAIDEALRRFDGGGPRAPARTPAPTRNWGRPQIAALASVALVVLVSVPIWWAERDRIGPQPAPPAARTTASVDLAPAPQAPPEAIAAVPNLVPVERSPKTTSVAEPLTPPVVQQGVTDEAPALGAVADALPPSEGREQASPSRRLAAPPPPAPPPPPLPAPPRQASAREDSDSAIVVTGSRVQRPSFNSSSPVTVVGEEVLGEDARNACTLADPDRDLAACRAVAGPAATGRAGSQLADGLALGWQGDFDGAIAAFDRAIRVSPDLAIAFLNRGLAWQEKGELDRALADMNRAVARDRNSARSYYHRSQLHRERGDDARADADAKRAIALDPTYAAVFP